MSDKSTGLIPVAHLDNGGMTSAEINGVDVLVCKVNDTYYAVSEMCSHARQKLSAGKLRGHEIICPLHGARFDVRDGACLSPPAKRPLAQFDITVVGDSVEVTVTDDAKPPKPKFGPIV